MNIDVRQFSNVDNPNLKRAYLRGLEVILLHQDSKQEILYHKLTKGKFWSITTSEQHFFEGFMLVKGSMRLQSSEEELVITPGYMIEGNPINRHIIFQALTDCEFVYVSSMSFFESYFQKTKQMQDLAVAIEQKDGYTAEHCNRIMHYSMQVGKAYGLTNDELYILSFASYFHDIGKIKVPDHIFQKPGALTNEEFDVIKRHTTYGKALLEETDITELVQAAPIVEQHHERFDGKGYPHGLNHQEIDIRAAIIFVVDSYDAMTTDRIYRKALSKEKAIHELISNKEKMYHPDVVDIFVDMISPENPSG
ncbi:MAG: HD domain-containing protein [Bacillaceae bacterium]|nr:HD domain-containing protein [Bacillaceae bacterium]